MTSIMENKKELPLKNGGYEKLIAVVFTLILWQIASMVLDKEILLVSPIKVIIQLSELIFLKDFWKAVIFSLSHIILGYSIALLVGTLMAMAASRFYWVEVLLWPIMTVIKSTPVASFIILCLIWLSSKSLPIFISFLMVLPVIYTSMYQGIKSTDKKLLEMADIFNLSFLKRVKYIYLPELKPYILSSCSVSLGLCWKAGIAAEVIGIPEGSIGEMLYQAKLYLNSKELFAWTAVIILLSIAFEKLFLGCLKWFYLHLERS